MPRNPRPHFLLPGVVTTTAAYQTPNRGGRPYATPPRDRQEQAALLRARLANVAEAMSVSRTEQEESGWDSGFGLTVLFTSFPDVQLAIDSLEQKAAGIELLSVREQDGGTLASVWIPDGKLEVFERKVAAYLERAAHDNQKLIDAIRDIRTAVVEDLWTDEAPLPSDDTLARFEVWVSAPIVGARGTRSMLPPDARLERFREAAQMAGLIVSETALRFPERMVLQVRGTLGQIRGSAHLLGQVAELRYAPESAHFFMELPREDQQEWGRELLQRATFLPPNDRTPYVCILDTGVTQAHPLLMPALSTADMYTVNPGWGTFDDHGHGTEQSGIAIWGDLTDALVGQHLIAVSHRLESVKIQPGDGVNSDEHLGPITLQAISRPEIAVPGRRRLFSMAITSTRTTLRGKPTAWSATVDALTSDWADNGSAPRLMIVSGGNVDHDRGGDYFARNTTTSIEDPAQAWNAVTVGALTHKTTVMEPGMGHYVPMASGGGLSPFSSCSSTWHREAPFKPDVVFEGGNLANDPTGFVSRADSLSLLTTYHRPAERQLACTEATSAATAMASRFAAQLMARYSEFWPQTIRALMVHSADWTPELLRQFPGSSKEAVEHRLRHCGWGEPNLENAVSSGADALTLVVQGNLQPFERKPVTIVNGSRRGGSIGTRDMQIHKLPWPRDALRGLLAQQMQLRVTLSYFIEPNPGERGRSTRFSYASHGLRFALQRPTETLEQFQQRVNRLARDAEEGFEAIGGGNPGWILGPRRRFRGSLHHDRLSCTAAELAAREHIAVYPVGGWWKVREAQARFDASTGYSLVVSTHAPDIPLEVDLYAETENVIATLVSSLPVGIG